MRIKGLQLAGLAVALVGGGAKDALAATTVSGATTTPLATSSAGNITINSGGSIPGAAGQAATPADRAGLNITNNSTLSSNNPHHSPRILLGHGRPGPTPTRRADPPGGG